ncbi:MAG: sensor histidine kinase KdpD [Methanospirillum sp.]|nr:sensor histidine kinase KdpD [Methanospirillum sp.]
MTGNDGRPSPEDLLVLAMDEERQRAEGRLTVYLGYAAGVGKTYTMLADALARRSDGVDVVIGYVETHGRAETDALAARLEAVPAVTVEYQGLRLREMDVDGVIARRPDVALVDELAHDAAPGRRHAKRYQEIEELLRAGISVWTTVNIQHIESERDAVARITGVRVRETVPDTVLERADDLRLIDLPPDQLIERLQAGKVYVQDMAARAVERFFLPANLTALRQLALRFVAGAADREMVGMMRSQAIAGPWPAAERVLVGVRAGPYADQMVRAGYRMATRMQAGWTVLSVETEGDLEARGEDRARLREALELARTLGAEIVRYRAEDVAGEIVRYARRANVTVILLGKPRGLGILLSPVYRVMRETRGIALHLLDPLEDVPIPIHRQLPRPPTLDVAVGLILMGLVTCANYLLRDTISSSNLLIIQLVPVVLAALFLGRAVSAFIAVLSIVVFDFLFVPPYHTIAVSDWEYFISFIGYLVIALVISSLAGRLRHLLPQIHESEATVEAVAGLARDLEGAATRQQVYDRLADHIRQYTGRPTVVLVPRAGRLVRGAGDTEFPLDDKEEAIAAWVYENRAPAGHGKETLPAGIGQYLPLVASGRALGVVGVIPRDGEEGSIPEMLERMARLAALVLDRLG